VDKAFLLKSGKGKIGLVAGFEEIFTFGGYHGSGLSPGTDLIFSPHAGAVIQYGNLRFRINYAYMNLNLAYTGAGWCNISIELLLNRKNGTLRQIPVQRNQK
jgi:hypothetical protein